VRTSKIIILTRENHKRIKFNREIAIYVALREVIALADIYFWKIIVCVSIGIEV